jgi:hypothetical protein
MVMPMKPADTPHPLPALPRAFALALCLALPCPAVEASVLYKSIGPHGEIQFSDVPPEGALVVETRTIPDAVRPPPQPVTILADASPTGGDDTAAPGEDDSLARANAQMDLAEHAFALSRRSLWSPQAGLRLDFSRETSADSARVAFYRRNLYAARRNLVAVLAARGS